MDAGPCILNKLFTSHANHEQKQVNLELPQAFAASIDKCPFPLTRMTGGENTACTSTNDAVRPSLGKECS